MPKALTYNDGSFRYFDSLGQQDAGQYERVWWDVDAPPSNPVLDGDGWREMTEQEIADIEAQKEQARLQQVATEYAVPLQQFADAWAETGVETVPESWDDALTLLGQSGAGSDVFCRLLALRFGPLAPVWDDALLILNGGSEG